MEKPPKNGNFLSLVKMLLRKRFYFGIRRASSIVHKVLINDFCSILFTHEDADFSFVSLLVGFQEDIRKIERAFHDGCFGISFLLE